MIFGPLFMLLVLAVVIAVVVILVRWLGGPWYGAQPPYQPPPSRAPLEERAIAEMARVLKPGGRLIIGELGGRSLWAAYRRIRGWLGHPLWRAARFRSQAELRQLVSGAGLDVLEMRGAAYYPPCGAAARLLAVVDPWLGRRTTLGAAFIALSAAKPVGAVLPGREK